MEKITINPSRVRGKGNILSAKLSRDFGTVYASLSKSKTQIENYDHDVFRLIYEPNSRFNVVYPEWMPFINQNNPLEITATLVNTYNHPLANKHITFNGDEYVTDSKGEVTFTIKNVDIDYGVLNYELEFIGTDRIPSASDSFSVQLGYTRRFAGPSVIDQEVDYGYSILVTDRDGNPVNDIPVHFNFLTSNFTSLGVFQTSTDEDGVARCTKNILGYSGEMTVEVTIEHAEPIISTVQVNELPTVYEVLSDLGITKVVKNLIRNNTSNNKNISFTDAALTDNSDLSVIDGAVKNLRIEKGIVKYDTYTPESETNSPYMTSADRKALNGLIYDLEYENRIITFETIEIEEEE